MITAKSLTGSWIYHPDRCPNDKKGLKTAFHFVGDATYVMEIDLDPGTLVTWFQYWPSEKGIIKYPLSKDTRALFDQGEEQVIEIGEDKLIVDGFLMTPLHGRASPPRWDSTPGSRIDEHGNLVQGTFRSKLSAPLDQLPTAQQDGAA